MPILHHSPLQFYSSSCLSRPRRTDRQTDRQAATTAIRSSWNSSVPAFRSLASSLVLSQKYLYLFRLALCVFYSGSTGKSFFLSFPPISRFLLLLSALFLPVFYFPVSPRVPILLFFFYFPFVVGFPPSSKSSLVFWSFVVNQPPLFSSIVSPVKPTEKREKGRGRGKTTER